MRRAELALGAGLMAAAHGLFAFGSTSESWLGGTQPWESVPYFELNAGIHATGGDGRPALGPLLEWGILDPLMLAGSWDQPVDGSAGAGEALLKVREPDMPRWRPAFAAYVRTGLGSRPLAAQPGLVLAIEPWAQSLVANIETGPQGLGLRFGYWTPYVTSFVRLGFDAAWPAAGEPWSLTPQLTLQAPGDLSAVLGASTFADGSGRWSWALRVSYELFPSP